jgi:hypothetical protein
MIMMVVIFGLIIIFNVLAFTAYAFIFLKNATVAVTQSKMQFADEKKTQICVPA